MSIECSYCERDIRGPHSPTCDNPVVVVRRVYPNATIQKKKNRWVLFNGEKPNKAISEGRTAGIAWRGAATEIRKTPNVKGNGRAGDAPTDGDDK